MPSVFLSNANHIFNKLDELRALTSIMSLDIICITETWLNAEIPDSAIHLPGYVVYRKDRSTGQGGGVLCFVRSNVKSFMLEPANNVNHEFEILWLGIRPEILPRPVSIIVVAIVYCPPWYNSEMKRNLTKTIMSGVDAISSKYSNACFLILGDFNSLDVKFFGRNLHFKQLVKQNTRANKILDMIFTNFIQNFVESSILPPLGRSDHTCVYLSSSGVCRAAADV